MRIKTVIMRNWQCYRGEHRLDLDAKVYAIVARHKSDGERSNWLGKTTLPEAIRFALDGTHRHQKRSEDGWITNGEREGSVLVEFDDGSTIERARVRGKATRVTQAAAGGVNPRIRDEAQAELTRLMGLTPDDFAATCYFEQRAMARFILADPSARMAVVSSWLRLAPLEQAEELLRARVADDSLKAEKIARNVATAQEVERRELGAHKTLEQLDEAVVEQAGVVEVANGRLAAFQDRLSRIEQLSKARANADLFKRVAEEGIALREELKTYDAAALRRAAEVARAAAVAATDARNETAREHEKKRVVATGRFDGACPVSPRTCPVAAEINADKEKGAAAARSAYEARAEAQRAYEEASAADRAAQAALGEVERKEERLEDLRRRARELKADHDAAAADASEPEDPAVLRGEASAAHASVTEAVTKLAGLRRAREAVAAAREEQRQLSRATEGLAATVATGREALVLFGKQGAQRRVAESALSRIEAGANDMLRECGIDLSVAIMWAREGTGLAKSCELCGHPFPASAKAKRCERCDAERGANLVNKLTVELSNRSGAAEDLAGAAVQLAASAWLRAERGSAWSTAFLDEPFGMLDAANRRQFAAHLTAMLRGRYGFEQALVIAHHASVLDALPGRIEVLSDGVHAAPRVVA